MLCEYDKDYTCKCAYVSILCVIIKLCVHVYRMQSDGGLTPTDRFIGSRAVLSGPAGGVVGYAMTMREEEEGPVIGFNMGSTSTDVSRLMEIMSTCLRALQLVWLYKHLKYAPISISKLCPFICFIETPISLHDIQFSSQNLQ